MQLCFVRMPSGKPTHAQISMVLNGHVKIAQAED